jgi:hypothetical protein
MGWQGIGILSQATATVQFRQVSQVYVVSKEKIEKELV